MIFALSRNATLISIGYVDCVGIEFLRLEHVQLRAKRGSSLVVGGKRGCYRDAKELHTEETLTKCLTLHAKSRCQKPNAKQIGVNVIYQVYQHTQSHEI